VTEALSAGLAGTAGRMEPGRWARVWLAARFALANWRAPTLALLGFLARGGIVLLLLPSVVLPSMNDIIGFFGVRGVTISGEVTPWFLGVVAVLVTLVAAWLLLAGWLGSVVDFWLVSMARRRAGGADNRLPLPLMTMLLRLLAIRAVCLGPVVAALGWVWVSGRLYDAAYGELTSPTDLATPLLIRILADVPDVIGVVVVVWLAAEIFASIAVRRQILLRRGVWRSIWETALEIVRRPLSTALAAVVPYVCSAAATVGSMAAIWVAFDWCRVAARNSTPIAVRLGIGDFATTRDFRPLVFMAAIVALVLAWVLALAVAGVASAWRSAAMTDEVGATTGHSDRIGGRRARPGMGLSGRGAARSGD
jgi:hypothetical protein